MKMILAMAGNAAGQQGGGFASSLIVLVAIFVIFYFLLIRPQQKQQKQLQDMRASLQKGDKIITSGGIYGTVSSITDSEVTLEVADKVKIKRLGKKYLGQWKFPDEEQMIEFGIEDDEDPRVVANKKYGKKVLALMIKRYSEVIDEMLNGEKEKLIHYHQKAQEFINSNFSNLYKDCDPIGFYKQLEKKIKSKKYY